MDTLVVDLPSVEESEYARTYGDKIGQGAFRAVYRIAGSGWAYKFERTDEEAWFKDTKPNTTEMRNYTQHRDKLPEGVDFPEMVMLDNGAIAVRFIEGVLTENIHADWKDCICASHGIVGCWAKKVESTGFRDMHGRNVMLGNDKVLYIIDIGEYGR